MEFVQHKSIHDEAVRKIRENFQHLDIDLFVHILSSRLYECILAKSRKFLILISSHPRSKEFSWVQWDISLV